MAAINNRTYIRITPEGTGDRILFYHTFDVEFTGRTANPVAVGDIIVGQNSATEARVVLVKDDPAAANSGVISTILSVGHEGDSFTPGENLLVNSLVVAVAGANYCIYANVSTLAGGNNPHNLQSIDRTGAAYIRFAEGAPQLDAFGKTQVSQQHKIAEYIMSYNELPNDFTDLQVGGATLTYNNNTRGVTLQCGTASGDHYQRTSDEYHVSHSAH